MKPERLKAMILQIYVASARSAGGQDTLPQNLEALPLCSDQETDLDHLWL